MPPESAGEQSQSTPQGINMSAERQQPEFDQAQVDRVVAELRANEARGGTPGVPESVQRMRDAEMAQAEKLADNQPRFETKGKITNMLNQPPGPGDLNGDPAQYAEMLRIQAELGIREFDLGGQERIRQEREGPLRYYEGSLLDETARSSYEPQLIREGVREKTAIIEGDIQMAELYALNRIRAQLRDRGRIFTIAQNPSESWKKQLQDWRLISREDLQPPYVRVGEVYQVSLVSPEAHAKFLETFPQQETRLRGNAEKGWKITLSPSQFEQLQMSDAWPEIARARVKTTIPGVVEEEKLPELAAVCESLAKEVWIRQRFFNASALYAQSAGLVDQVCKLFEDKRYSELTSQEWEGLFELEPTYEGERAFGEKIDMTMRIYTLIGYGGGGTQGDASEARQRLTTEMDRLVWVPEFLQELGLSRDEFLNRVAPMAARNIFTQGSPFEAGGPRDQEWYEEVRETVRGIIGGNERDTKAADELGSRIFYMWGMATHFDGRKSPNETVGWPGSDDRMKLAHFETWRRREQSGSHNQGPHSTLNKYDELAREFGLVGGRFNMAVSFLHWALPTKEGADEIEVGNMESFYERWWNKGIDMKDLPWDTVRTIAWWYYNLGLYFGGAYGHQHEKDMLELLTKDMWKRDEFVNTNSLQDIIRTIEYTIGGTAITEGEIKAWTQQFEGNSPNAQSRREWAQKLIKQANEARKFKHEAASARGERSELKLIPENKAVGEMTSGEFSDVFIEAYRKRIRELLLFGAITSKYMSHPFVDAVKDWSLWWEELGFHPDQWKEKASNKRTENDMGFLITSSNYLDARSYERVIRDAHDLLKSMKVLSR